MNITVGAQLPAAASLALLIACSSGGERLPAALPLGTWGGDSAEMEVSDSTIHLQIACTYGDAPAPVAIGGDGWFSVAGSYMLYAYPVARLPPVPAQFIGRLSGTTVTITVVADDTVTHQQVTHGPAVLRLGATPHWGPCPI